MKNLKLLLSFIFFFFFAYISSGQIKIQHYAHKSNTSVAPEGTFPYIILKKGAAKSYAFNTKVIKEILPADSFKIDTAKKSIFVYNQSAIMPYINHVDDSIYLNNASFASFSYEAEGCGAYCESFKKYFNFDLRSQDYIDIKSLFTDSSYITFLNTIKVNYYNSIEDIINILRKDSANIFGPKGWNNVTCSELTKLYTDCRQYVTGQSKFLFQFYIRDGELHVVIPRCFPHAYLAYDLLSDIDIGYTYSELELLMSNYGKEVLGNKN